MTTDVVKYAFTAGEISPTLLGRTDLTRYDLAVAEGQNFFVDYRGGLSSRPGFEFCDFVNEDSKATRAFPFNFSSDLSNSYVAYFGENYVRFLQDGAYVLSATTAITGVSAGGVVTSVAHGLTTGKWVKLASVGGLAGLNNRSFEITVLTADTFQLRDPLTGAAIAASDYGTYTSGGTVAAVYELATVYPASALQELVVYQYRDLFRLTHKDYPVYNLKRTAHASWTLELETFTPALSGPTITTASSTAPDGTATPPEIAAQVVFSVSQVNKDGDESTNGNLYLISNTVNYTVVEGSVRIQWTGTTDAVYYNVYRSVVASRGSLIEGNELGYVGFSRGTSFTDPNITPDFSKTPLKNNDPFAPGKIERVRVTAGGTGFTKFAATVTITDPDGTGFEGQVVVDESGAVVNVIVKKPGKGYTAPTVSFGGGTGATAVAEAAPLTGTYPGLSAIFQQRQIYAASTNNPITIWGSRYKRFSNFDSSDLVLDNDSFEFDLDTQAIAPIRHMLVTRGGLLLFTQENIWLLSGGGANEALTPTNALADPQTYTGISLLPPLPIDSDVLYREGKGAAVRLLSYDDRSRVYGGEDKSILANHLFGLGKDIVSWCYQESPFKIVWAVREDGVMLAFTIVKPEEVYAWTPTTTRGKFLNVVNVREGTTDRVYVTTERKINGRYTKFIERMSLRNFTNVEDAWCVDAGLSLPATYPAGTITISVVDGVWSVQSSTTSFASGDVGKFIRAAQGIFKITSFVSTSKVVVETFAEPENFIPEREAKETWPITTGNWTMDSPVTTLSNLWHLEGESVSILADGNVFDNQVVTNGTITLDYGVTRAVVGLGYTCRAKSLPISIASPSSRTGAVEAKRKRVVGIAVRLDRSRGLKVGRTLAELYEMRERTNEPYGRPIKLINGYKYQLVSGGWDENGQSYFVLDKPLPATILSLVFDMEVGDDPD